MKVCIPSQFPGGPDSVASASFEDTEFFDFYEIRSDGSFEHLAQSRPCACSGPNLVEVVAWRGINAIIVGGISPSALLLFRSAGVRVLKVNNPAVAVLLDSYSAGKLEEIGIDQFAKVGKVKVRG